MDMNGTNRVRVGNGSEGAENTVNPSEIMFLTCNLQECNDMRIVLALPGGGLIFHYLLQPWVHTTRGVP